MKSIQLFCLCTFFVSIIFSSCSKDEIIEEAITDNSKSEVSFRSTDGEYCGLIPLFCSKEISTLPHYPPYSEHVLQPGLTTGSGTNETGVRINTGNTDVEVVHYWMSDKSLAFYVVDGDEKYIIHQSADPYAQYYSSENTENNELSRLFELDLTGVTSKNEFSQKIAGLAGSNASISGGEITYSLTKATNTNTSHRVIKGCNAIRYSAVENFIAQFTDHNGLGSPQLPGIIEGAFNSCGDGYEDRCNNCVDPRCVIDELIKPNIPGVGIFQKELMVAKYLELALGWEQEEFDFFTSSQANRDYMMNLYAIGSSLDACAHIQTIRSVFDDAVCDLTLGSEEYKRCIEEEIFIRHEIEKGDFDRSIDLCSVLECFDLMTMDVNGYYEITLYVDQPTTNSRETWSMNGKPDVGHTFIGLKSVINGFETSILFGFYPDHENGASPANPLADGEIRNDAIDNDGFLNPRNYDVAVRYVVDVSTFNSFITFIQNDDCEGLDQYHLENNNCSDYILNIFEMLQFGGDIPDTQGDWGIGGGTNPGDLGEDLRSEYPLPVGSTLLEGPSTPDTPVNCIEE